MVTKSKGYDQMKKKESIFYPQLWVRKGWNEIQFLHFDRDFPWSSIVSISGTQGTRSQCSYYYDSVCVTQTLDGPIYSTLYFTYAN